MGWNSRISQAERERVQCCQDDYFSLKWFKKGTEHVGFRRADLVNKMNSILAKHHPNAVAFEAT